MKNLVFFFISGYIAFKESITCDECVLNSDEAYEFTDLVNRGKLTYPPNELYVFSVYAYTLFTKCKMECANRVSRYFQLLYESLFFEFEKMLCCMSTLCKLFLRFHNKRRRFAKCKKAFEN